MYYIMYTYKVQEHKNPQIVSNPQTCPFTACLQPWPEVSVPFDGRTKRMAGEPSGACRVIHAVIQ